MWQKFKEIPIIIQLLIVGVFLYFLYRVYVYFFITRPRESNYNAAVNQAQTSLNELEQQGIKPSYGQSEYTSMANALEQTFTGCGLDWSGVVVPTFQKMKNDADAYALVQNYGVRNFDECGWGSFTGDLASALTYKTSGVILTIPNQSDIFTDASIKSINKILSQNGLKFQF